MERVRLEREAYVTEKATKLTGRQLFEKNKNAFEDLILEEESSAADMDPKDLKAIDNDEEEKDDDDNTPFVYDRALYDANDDDLDEDVDFD